MKLRDILAVSILLVSCGRSVTDNAGKADKTDSLSVYLDNDSSNVLTPTEKTKLDLNDFPNLPRKFYLLREINGELVVLRICGQDSYTDLVETGQILLWHVITPSDEHGSLIQEIQSNNGIYTIRCKDEGVPEEIFTIIPDINNPNIVRINGSPYTTKPELFKEVKNDEGCF